MGSDIHNVGVIGIGLMGSGIAQVAASRGFETIVVDVTSELVDKGMSRIRQSLDRLVESHSKSGGKSGIPPTGKEETLSHLTASTDRKELLQSDIIIEAIVENESAKKEISKSLSASGYTKLLVSNTSSISITRLASAYS